MTFRTLICLGAALLASGAQDPVPRPAIERSFRPGEERVWVFEADGVRLGEHVSRYLGRDMLAGVSAHHFHGRARLKVSPLGEVEQRSTADLWTDDDGHVVRFTQQLLLGESYARVELAFAGGKVAAHVVQGPSVRDLELKAGSAAFVLANNYVSHIELAIALLEPGKDAKLEMFSGSTLQSFPYRLKAAGTFERETGGVRSTGHVYEDSLGERLRFVDGRLLDVEVAAQKLVIRFSDEKVAAFSIAPPAIREAAARFDGEDVRIARGDAVIAGRVTKPKGAAGRLPAVLFISGSGAQDRNGLSAGIDLGTHEILDRLTSDGFLVLRVDDRGAGESSPLPPDASYLDLVGDARAALEFLARRDDVDPARIALIGHSEGGETAPLLAAESPRVAAVVLMAAPGRSLLAIITDQNRMALEQSGLSGDELEKQLNDVVALLKRLCGTGAIDPAELPADQRSVLTNRAWLQSHALQDPIATIRRVRCPVLILQGAKDFQVSLERDARALEAALSVAEHPDHELRAFAELDHLFKKVPGAKSELADYAKDRRVDAEFLDVLSGWLRHRLQPTPR